ncbi:MAG: hypothetical protein P1P83_13385 [Bacteroidales bacterium]|nr:hypothetical protein [Bacteroidales bacterium]MDT8374425.1 hypothetical protein [Bacteroidales bacterium]
MKSRYYGSASVTLFLSVIFFLQVISLGGQDVVADSVTDNRVQDIQLTALKDKQNAQVWWYGWLAGYSAATAGQAIVSLSTDNLATRQDMVLGAATTLLGALGQLVTPIVPKNANTDYPSYRDYVSGVRTFSEEEAAELLKALAIREKEGRSWKTHAVSGVVNLGSGLITWLGFKRTVWGGLANFALNTAVTEAQIWTQPARAIKDYERYLREYHPEAGVAPLKPDSEWTVSVFPGGIALRVDF